MQACTTTRAGGVEARIVDPVGRIVWPASGEAGRAELALLEELCDVVQATSLCGLGQTAPNPVLTTIQHFRGEYEAHIHEKICPAHACVDLVKFDIDMEKCTMCGMCYRACPVQAISWEKKQPAKLDKEYIQERIREIIPLVKECYDLALAEHLFRRGMAIRQRFAPGSTREATMRFSSA